MEDLDSGKEGEMSQSTANITINKDVCVGVEALVPVGSVLLDTLLQPLTLSPGEVLPHMWS